jgi:hypothetical protein
VDSPVNHKGRDSFAIPESVARGKPRPLRNPAAADAYLYFLFYFSRNPNIGHTVRYTHTAASRFEGLWR